jgi:hypothetical protein
VGQESNRQPAVLEPAAVRSAALKDGHERMGLDPSRPLDGLVLDQQSALERAHALFAGVLERWPQELGHSPDNDPVDPVDPVVDGPTHAVEAAATITCPQCGGRQLVEMPTDACQIRFTCTFCGATHRPLAGDCCVLPICAAHLNSWRAR